MIKKIVRLTVRIPLFALAVATILGATTLQAQLASEGGSIHFLGENGQIRRGQRCGVRDVSPEKMAEIRAVLFGPAFGAEETSEEVAIPVRFHILQDGASGGVSDARLEAQINVLNAAFAGSGFTFFTASTERIEDPRAFRNCGDNERFKKALAVDPARNLNIYTCEPGGGLLGYANFPYFDSEGSWRHGMVLLHSSLPGGSAAPYNLGDTATHELGHYLGLFHTFAGGCRFGDFISDTPAEKSPAGGCPVGRNSCPWHAGLDPILNFMDYTDDACMDRFSAEQMVVMRRAKRQYRPHLGD